jgi:hypothetical protein
MDRRYFVKYYVDDTVSEWTNITCYSREEAEDTAYQLSEDGYSDITIEEWAGGVIRKIQ